MTIGQLPFIRKIVKATDSLLLNENMQFLNNVNTISVFRRKQNSKKHLIF